VSLPTAFFVPFEMKEKSDEKSKGFMVHRRRATAMDFTVDGQVGNISASLSTDLLRRNDLQAA
jgi:hypothetical protein